MSSIVKLAKGSWHGHHNSSHHILIIDQKKKRKVVGKAACQLRLLKVLPQKPLKVLPQKPPELCLLLSQ